MPAKKTTVKKAAVKKVAVKKATPVVEQKCACGEDCHCHCHGRAHWVKHVIVWAIIFALGMVCGKIMNCGHGPKHMPKLNPVFVNGCLDKESIKCPMMQEKLAKADANADECISVEEYKVFKKEMKPDFQKSKKGFNKGPKGFKGHNFPRPQKIEK